MKKPKIVSKPAPMAKLESPPYWRWIGEFLKLVAAGVVAAIATVWGSTLDYWNKGRDLDIRMVDVGLTILSGQNEGAKSQPARRYAIDLLEKYGAMPIKDKEEWISNGELPIGKFPSWDRPLLGTTMEKYIGPNPKDSVVRDSKSNFAE